MSDNQNEDDKDHPLPMESADDRVLRMLGDAEIAADATIVLPSGRVLSGDEAQVFSAAFHRGQPGFGPEDDPYDDLDKEVVEHGASSSLTGDPLLDRHLWNQRIANVLGPIQRAHDSNRLVKPLRLAYSRPNLFVRIIRRITRRFRRH